MARISGRRKAWVIRWLVAILLLAALTGALALRIHSANQTLRQATATSANTSVSDETAASLSPTAIHAGQVAPDFTFTPDNGPSAAPVRLSSLRGHVVVVNFWSPTCAPCHDEAPILARSARQYASKGIVFLGVAFESGRAEVVSFLRQYHITYPCGLDNAYTIATAYGLLAIPVTVVVGSAGVVVRVIQGAVTSDTLERALALALHETAPASDARERPHQAVWSAAGRAASI